jgi:hypothetical protein
MLVFEYERIFMVTLLTFKRRKYVCVCVCVCVCKRAFYTVM